MYVYLYVIYMIIYMNTLEHVKERISLVSYLLLVIIHHDYKSIHKIYKLIHFDPNQCRKKNPAN